MRILRYCLISYFLLFAQATLAQTFTSAGKTVNVLELYSSQGCSSCPPAENWLGKFKKDSRLWNEIIPINFHVDYWDHLGWKDPFAKKDFSQRQRLYALLNRSNIVATPGFFINGHYWKGWFTGKPVPFKQTASSHELSASISNKDLHTHFKTSLKLTTPEVHIAILGFDISTYIKVGENHGSTLNDNFIVLGHSTQALTANQDGYQQTLPLPNIPTKYAKAIKGIAIWISESGDPTPIQATGGWLK